MLKSPGPYFPAAEAVLIHLEERQVRSVFEMIAERLPDALLALLALETAAGRMVDGQDSHDVLGKVAARMHWRCHDPTALEHWHPGLRLADSCTFDRLPARWPAGSARPTA
ncbi:hypothetical protein J7F01_23085 [Streptomyces sp. ISL-22]|uniref:hypothetical protein n=1 Tax=unclassified Streptomyces TaxID=2593676 RepID=UPI001BE63D2E|nr:MULTISPECIES: hypothetical protein [unclassified Streptomyces]MBT2420442.1 hypothetical protein [Streptomyces sp. ISL-24]MBT2435002.1 hypothetical protein [Streptomyces sp. ISL-22]